MSLFRCGAKTISSGYCPLAQYPPSGFVLLTFPKEEEEKAAQSGTWFFRLDRQAQRGGGKKKSNIIPSFMAQFIPPPPTDGLPLIPYVLYCRYYTKKGNCSGAKERLLFLPPLLFSPPLDPTAAAPWL